MTDYSAKQIAVQYLRANVAWPRLGPNPALLEQLVADMLVKGADARYP